MRGSCRLRGGGPGNGGHAAGPTRFRGTRHGRQVRVGSPQDQISIEGCGGRRDWCWGALRLEAHEGVFTEQDVLNVV